MTCSTGTATRFAMLMFAVACGSTVAQAAPPKVPVRIIQSLSMEKKGVEDAYEQAQGQHCEAIPAGRPVELSSFIPEELDLSRGALPIPTARRPVISIGLDIAAADRAQLPTLSGGQIIAYMEQNFVSVSARVCQDLDSGDLFLHHRPLAATVNYKGAKVTQDFDEFVLKSVQNIRSLGVFPSSDDLTDPKAMRTVVMVYKNAIADPVIESKTNLTYEYVFLRGRERKRGGSKQLDLYIFATEKNRRELLRVPEYRHPTRASQCSVVGEIHFTKYRFGNLLPAESVTRKVEYRAAERYSFEMLDRKAKEQGWQNFVEHLPAALDKLIDREWRGDL